MFDEHVEPVEAPAVSLYLSMEDLTTAQRDRAGELREGRAADDSLGEQFRLGQRVQHRLHPIVKLWFDRTEGV